ncbi:MAG: hypothetical protein IJD48_02025 [Clostridia bacterium]|nr:hypothetical protein [Clostridia bacterium]
MEDKKPLFHFGKRDLREPNHWKNLDFEEFSFREDGVTILCFEGNGTTIKYNEDGTPNYSNANAGCRRVESLMGIKIEATDDIYSTYKDVDLVGFSYPRVNGQNYGEMTEQCYKYLDEKFMTLYTDKDGSLLPIDSIMKNFSKLVFSSHCYGAIVVDRIFSNINKNMLQRGMSQEQVLNVFAQSAHVTYAPHTDCSFLPTVRVESFTDSVHRYLPSLYSEKYHSKLDGIKIYHNPAGILNNSPSFASRQETIQIFSSRLINTVDNTDLTRLKDEHEAHYLTRDANWNSSPRCGDEPLSEHAVNLDITSQMIGYALSMLAANAIENANTKDLIPKPSMQELAGHLQGILESVPEEDLRAKEAPVTPTEQEPLAQ